MTSHLCCFVAAAAILFGQDEVRRPSFEVASVKAPGPQENTLGRGVFRFTGGRIGAYKCTLEKLIEEAFRVQPFQILGGPRWLHDDRYNIEAKPPASSLLSETAASNPNSPLNDIQRQMLQALLVDRFQLKYHRETRQGNVYLLLRGKGELKLQEVRNKGDYHWAGSLGGAAISGDGLAGQNETMEDLAKRLSPFLGCPVLDQTRLQGSFDFRYEYVSDDPHPDVIASILASVQGVGLKLETAKGPVDMFVVDQAVKPSDN
jgi:uncharacterized protein (TIGR03435 family)